MKRFMLNTFLLTLAVALWGCGGSDSDDPQPDTVTITISQESMFYHARSAKSTQG